MRLLCLEIQNSDLILARMLLFFLELAYIIILIPSVPLIVEIWPSVKVINVIKWKGELTVFAMGLK